ncbi:hypothetical protein BV22DRAFT_1030234 [Leucogyrophana mollusca]|uniref:Uncharacterized protein n=1 Tax=Leucogyrophana mollusca TaxID=85980 RepID=A0ACB8BTX7_9AGAM|nr:hypothetical protein BV22DRAFT_1030234 [Leucogyrophana mollusca]
MPRRLSCAQRSERILHMEANERLFESKPDLVHVSSQYSSDSDHIISSSSSVHVCLPRRAL